MSPPRTPRNAPGDFYVVAGECIECGAPEQEAPDLMGHDDEHHSCYFRRQPSTDDQRSRAILAVWASCCGAVRYEGSDPDVIRRIESLGATRSS